MPRQNDETCSEMAERLSEGDITITRYPKVDSPLYYTRVKHRQLGFRYDNRHCIQSAPGKFSKRDLF